jgi:hypothetical protein
VAEYGGFLIEKSMAYMARDLPIIYLFIPHAGASAGPREDVAFFFTFMYF